MAAPIRNLSYAVTLLALVLLAILCSNDSSSVQAAYFYNRDTISNSHQQPKTAGYYSTGASSHHALHHKHHQQHDSNNGRLQQASVGIISRGRLAPYTASTITTTPSSKLSPLDRLMNRLDSEERQLPQVNHHSHATRFDQGKRHHEPSYLGSYPNRHHGSVSSSMLRSSADHRYAQLRSHTEDSYEDDDEDEEEEDDDEDVMDEGENVREEDEEDEDEEEENEEGRHQHPHRTHNNHKSGHTDGDLNWYDGAVADFPDRPSASSTGSSGTGSEGGNGQRRGGYSSISDWKWHVLNKPNMDIIRNNHHKVSYKTTTSDADLTKAVRHAVTVSKEGQCRVPKPRLIQVKDEYPSSSKTYIPHCTILHQCGDDTGCCRSDTLTCTARKSEPVELYFYTTTLGNSGGSRTRGGPTVEKLVFYNHTECVCVDRQEEFMPRDRPSSSSEADNLGRPRFRDQYRPDSDSGRAGSDNIESNCRCPSQFSARNVDGSCVCECFDKQRDCIRSKRGKEYLPHDDRICVLRGECTTPSCEFGTYLRRAGRCPRKREKFEAWQQYPLHDEEYK